MTNFGEVLSDTRLRQTLPIAINNFRQGATAPTDSTLGTTPTIPTLLFANVNELVSHEILLPRSGRDPNFDIRLIFDWSLAAVQLANDTLDITVDYVIIRDDVGDGGPTKTSSQMTGQITAVAGQLGIGDNYRMALTLDRTDANNPSDVANVTSVGFEFHLTNVTGIASAHLRGGCVEFTRTN